MKLTQWSFTVPLATVRSPVSTTVNQGSTATMICEYKGTGITSVTWISPSGSVLQNDGINVTITESGLLYVYNRSSMLQLHNVSRSEHEGWYICKGATEGGATIETRAYLTIHGIYCVVNL